MDRWTRHSEALTISDGGHGVLPDPGGHGAHAGVAVLSLEHMGTGGAGRAMAFHEQLQVRLYRLH